MKKELQGWIKKFRETYFSPEIDLSARVFFVLVIASMLFCLIITAVNFAAGVGTVGVVVDLASAAFCALILWYARTSRRIRQCQLITIVCVFFGLFPYLYFRMGGYHGGFTCVPDFCGGLHGLYAGRMACFWYYCAGTAFLYQDCMSFPTGIPSWYQIFRQRKIIFAAILWTF